MKIHRIHKDNLDNHMPHMFPLPYRVPSVQSLPYQYSYIPSYVLNYNIFPLLALPHNINPSFSKTTVYNALGALCESGLVIPVTLDAGRVRYDAHTQFHGHFKCDCCGKIFDFSCRESGIKGVEDFDIRQKDVYYSGLCSSCKNKN